MNLIVDRFTSDNETTLSRVLLDGRFICFGLEDEHRTFKVPGETRIPAGRYAIQLRTTGGTHQKYLARYGDQHHGMLHLQDVPGFEYILIHTGNRENESDGCLLVGMQANTSQGDMSVSQSRQAYQLLYSQVWQNAAIGQLWIEVQDNDLV